MVLGCLALSLLPVEDPAAIGAQLGTCIYQFLYNNNLSVCLFFINLVIITSERRVTIQQCNDVSKYVVHGSKNGLFSYNSLTYLQIIPPKYEATHVTPGREQGP